jgi:hypothetical protein
VPPVPLKSSLLRASGPGVPDVVAQQHHPKRPQGLELPGGQGEEVKPVTAEVSGGGEGLLAGEGEDEVKGEGGDQEEAGVEATKATNTADTGGGEGAGGRGEEGGDHGGSGDEAAIAEEVPSMVAPDSVEGISAGVQVQEANSGEAENKGAAHSEAEDADI